MTSLPAHESAVTRKTVQLHLHVFIGRKPMFVLTYIILSKYFPLFLLFTIKYLHILYSILIRLNHICHIWLNSIHFQCIFRVKAKFWISIKRGHNNTMTAMWKNYLSTSSAISYGVGQIFSWRDKLWEKYRNICEAQGYTWDPHSLRLVLIYSRSVC